MKKRTVALLLALVLLIGGAVGGTVAWLAMKTDSITNTFTAGNINITLTETDTDPNTDGNQYEFKMVPGAEITKDPTVTVKANSEACWLFVKVVEVNNADPQFLDYTIADDWTAVDGALGVYYCAVTAADADQEFPVLADDQVTVSEDITKSQLDTAETSGKLPTLTFTAYAVQQVGFATAAAAWVEAAKLG